MHGWPTSSRRRICRPARIASASATTPDGAAHYAFLVRNYTTTDLTPDQIHEIGLAEMAKTREAMEADPTSRSDSRAT